MEIVACQIAAVRQSDRTRGINPGVDIMTVERITFALVGVLIMGTVGAYLATQIEYFLYGTAFIGFMLFQAFFTGFCPVPMILKLLGVRTGSVFE
ncbi:MAG: DUF2892 domain-containing protein [Candidatus Thiodiazotropha sp.]|jgi:hypothetical protein